MRDDFKTTFADIPNNTNAKWYRDKCLRTNVRHCIGAGLCSYYLGYDQGLLGGLQALPAWNRFFGTPTGLRLGVFAATLFLPGIPFAFISEWMTTKWGRRIPIWIGCLLVIAGSIIMTFSQNEGMFLSSRVIIGIGGAIAKVVAPPTVQELAHPRLRSSLSTLYYSFIFAGSILSGIFTLIGLYIPGDWGWRLACLMQVIGPLNVLLFIVDMPESPRWLIKQGRLDQAKAIFAKSHANGDMDDPLINWEYEETVASIQAEETQKKASYLDFFRTKANRRRLLVCITCGAGTNMNGVGIVSWFLAPVLRTVGITAPVQLLTIQLGLSIWNLIISQTICLHADRFGRRPLFLSSEVGMVCAFAIVAALTASFEAGKGSSYGVAAVPFLYLYYGLYNLAWVPLPYAYATEVLPYNLRSKGMALFILAQNLGNAFNQFANPVALAAITWRYYLVYIAVDSAYFVMIYFCYPETSRMSMEEAALIFDYGGVKGGREKAIAAMAEMRLEREQAIEDGMQDEKKGNEVNMVEKVEEEHKNRSVA